MSAAMPDVEVIGAGDALDPLLPEWDALAVAAAQPTSAPGWMLPWWRHGRPSGAELRVVAVRDGEELIGVAPLCAIDAGSAGRAVYRPLAAEATSSLSLLAAAGREWEVAGAVAGALAQAVPRPRRVEVSPFPASSSWPFALRDQWPGRTRPLLLRGEVVAAPVISLAGHDTFDDWLKSRGRNFRASSRRRMKRFAEAGGTTRLADAETLVADLATFAELHRRRWEGRGSSRLVALGPRLVPLLSEVAAALLPGGRFRLRLAEVGGEAIGAELAIAAGGDVAAINTGWDERHAALSPAQLLTLAQVSDALDRGDRRIALGRGASPNKLAVAAGDEPVGEVTLLPVGGGLARELAQALPAQAARIAREGLRRGMTAERYDRLRTLRRRARPSPEAEPVPAPAPAPSR